VDGYFPNGTVEWPCGSINKGEGTSGTYTMQVQQTILATMSLGPVGLADQLSASPYNASAAITSNKTLVMTTCTADGMLLQPSYPLTPIDSMMIGAGAFGDCFTPSTHEAYTYGCGGHIWATYTAVAITSSSVEFFSRLHSANAEKVGVESAASASAVWFTAVGFVAGRGKPKATTIDIYESDLAAMIDGSGRCRGFADVSRFFLGVIEA